MLFPDLLTGFILIICGLLVKQYPNLIAGYNTMSARDREKVDFVKLSTMMRNYLVVIGAIVIIVGIILFLLDIKESLRLLSLSAIVVIGVFIMVFKGQKFTKP